jgi:hypothetical protein
VTAPDPSRKLAALLKKLRGTYGESCADAAGEGRPESADPLLWHLVYSFLCWEATPAKAAPANRRLHGAVVDYNEMRVCLPDELAAIIGDRYPRAQERVTRLRSTLNELYRREHAVTLAPAAAMGKREARLYLESLEGMPPYVAARLILLSMCGHAFPLDERLHGVLIEEDAVPPELSATDASGWLERHFRAGEAEPAYLLLEAWTNDRPAPRSAPRKTPVKPEEPADAARRPAKPAKPTAPRKKAAKE